MTKKHLTVSGFTTEGKSKSKFSLGPDTIVSGEVAKGVYVEVCYEEENGRKIVTAVHPDAPQYGSFEIPYAPQEGNVADLSQNHSSVIREVFGRIVGIRGSVINVKVPGVIKIKLDERTEISGEIKEGVTARIRYIFSCEAKTNVAVTVRVSDPN